MRTPYEELRAELSSEAKKAKFIDGIHEEVAKKFDISVSQLYKIRERDMLKESAENRKTLKKMTAYYKKRRLEELETI